MSVPFDTELFKLFFVFIIVPGLYWIGWGTLSLLMPRESFMRLTSVGLSRPPKPDGSRSDLIFSNEAMAIAFLGFCVVIALAVILQACGVDLLGLVTPAPAHVETQAKCREIH